MRGKLWFLLAGLLGATAVGLGAYHAHGLRPTFEQMSLTAEDIERRMGFVGTAYRYQMLHAVALLGVAITARWCPNSLTVRLSGSAFVLGIALFSGSLYGLAMTDNRAFARVAPIGGFALIVAWLLVAVMGFLPADSQARSGEN